MTIYYLTIILFLILGISYNRFIFSNPLKVFGFCLFSISFTLIFGLRDEVGVDWFNYIRVYEKQITDEVYFNTIEIGYKSVNLLSYYLNLDIQGVIVFTTLVFIVFTMIAATNIRVNPFYFFSVIAPYHFVMSGMNYTRQAVSLSIALYAYSLLLNDKIKTYIFFIALATTFHSSAILFLPLAFLMTKKRYIALSLMIVIPIAVVGIMRDYSMYIESEIDSKGVLLRVLFLITPTVILVSNLRNVLSNSRSLIVRLGLVSLCYLPICLIALPISSTLVDRVAYYFIVFISLYVFYLKSITQSERAGLLLRYSELLMFITSIIAFVVWTNFSSFIEAYEFKHIYLGAL